MLQIAHNYGDKFDAFVREYNVQLNILISRVNNQNTPPLNIASSILLCTKKLGQIVENACREFIEIYHQQFNNEKINISNIFNRFNENYRNTPNQNLQRIINNISNNLKELEEKPLKPNPKKIQNINIAQPEQLESQLAPHGRATKILNVTSYALIGVGFFAGVGGASYSIIKEQAARRATNAALGKAEEQLKIKIAEAAAAKLAVKTAEDGVKAATTEAGKKLAQEVLQTAVIDETLKKSDVVIAEAGKLLIKGSALVATLNQGVDVGTKVAGVGVAAAAVGTVGAIATEQPTISPDKANVNSNKVKPNT